MRVSRTLPVICLSLLAIVHPSSGAARAGGEVVVLSGTNARVLDRFADAANGDEFGTAWDSQAVFGTVRGGLAVGAPGADGAQGRLVVLDPFAGGEVVDRFDGSELGAGVRRFGQSLSQVGHIDGDFGVHWVVGAPGEPDADRSRPLVAVLRQRGREYEARLVVEGVAGSLFGWRVLALDRIPGDSTNSHFLVSAPRTSRGNKAEIGQVEAFDAVTGQSAWLRRGKRRGERFGTALATTPDMDGDGIADVVVGAPGDPEGKVRGRVYLLSGRTGAVLRTIDGPAEARLFGYSAVRLDFDRDGTSELWVGAPATASGAHEQAGAVYVVDDGGSVIRQFPGPEAGSWLGVSVTALNLDEDADLEIAISSLGRERRAKKDFRGRVTVHDPDGSEVRRLRGKRGGDFFGVAGLGGFVDVDGDDVLDVVVSSTGAAPSFLWMDPDL